MAVYGTPKNDSGVILSFGTVSNTVVVQSNAHESETLEGVPSPATSFKVFSGGTLSPYGDYVIFAGNQANINGLANAEAAVIGAKEVAQTGAPQKGRMVGVFSINRLTNEITYVANSWDTFDYRDSQDGTAVSADTVANSIAAPYSLPTKFSYLQDLEPQTVTYSTAG